VRPDSPAGETLQARRLVELAVARLRAEMLSGALEPGQRLLDVHVDQLAGMVALVAHRSGFEDRMTSPVNGSLASQRIALAQVGHLVATQDPADGAGRQPQLGAEPVLPATLGSAHRQHRLLGSGRRPGRAAVRARGPVEQAGFTLRGEPAHPPVGTLPRDPHRLGDVSDRHPGLDPGDQQPPAMKRQTGITVGHEDLRTVGDLDITHRTRRSSLTSTPRRCVTNVPAEYSWRRPQA
jgi:hypothetical protein